MEYQDPKRDLFSHQKRFLHQEEYLQVSTCLFTLSSYYMARQLQKKQLIIWNIN